MNDPFMLLPANLAGLARVALAGACHYALQGVRVEVSPEGYRAVATDGRHLALVSGPPAGDPLAYPPVPELADLPPSADVAVIPTQQWREAFAQAPKSKQGGAGVGVVAVHLGERESVLAVADGEKAEARSAANVPGRYPDYQKVIPTGEPVVRIHLDPRYLSNLIQLAKDVVGKEELPRITLEVHGPAVPLVITAQCGEQRLLALQMPLV